MKKNSYFHNNPSISSKMLVNIEKGFLHLQCMFRLQMWHQNGNVKKNVLFSPLFLYNLALITHDATMSVNPSIVNYCRFYCRTIAFAIYVASFSAKMLQHVQVIYFVIWCEAKFSKVRLEIFKCTWVKCLLETNLAPSVKPSNMSVK